MGIDKGIAHRSGTLKQTNKEHKHGRHRSKGSISLINKGKVSLKAATKNTTKTINRAERRNQANQLRIKKRQENLAKRRSLNELETAPVFVCLLPLDKNMDCTSTITVLTQIDPNAKVNQTETGVLHLFSPRYKQRLAFLKPTLTENMGILDTLKVSDTVLFLVSAVKNISETCDDTFFRNIISSSFSQGLPTPLICITDLDQLSPKQRLEFKQKVQNHFTKWLPDEKIFALDKEVDANNLLRRLSNQKLKPIFYRDHRSHLYAEKVEYIPNVENSTGSLKVSGYLRGTPLSVNGLVHLPGLGDFQMSQIDYVKDPYCIQKNRLDSISSSSLKSEFSDPEKQESLDSENILDPMDAEQTWPTNDELKAAEQKLEKVKRVPAGWSSYQAAWIPDNDCEEYYSDDSEPDQDDNDSMMSAMSEMGSGSEKKWPSNSIKDSEVPLNDDKYDDEMDMHDEKEALLKLAAAKSDLQFPDEVDTPSDQPARIRFQKYRGLESFRTSPWNPKENLPIDYGRIFEFQNFERTKKRILKQQKCAEGVSPGSYVTIHLKNISKLLWSNFKQHNLPVVLIGLFPNEHKMSVQNVVLKRTGKNCDPIKSKERLIFQCGYRRFVSNPIFSAHTNGQKHKFERFFQPNTTVVATFYAPIQFPPAPVLCFKEKDDGLELVATGNLLSCDPNRLIIKRIVLSGYPLKIHKRSAVIRFMFFNRDDINYFKPCQLRTRMGRLGHIKEALGTHGHMKCIFDGPLKSEDTILLNLYKRVFPKWTYDDFIFSDKIASDLAMET